MFVKRYLKLLKTCSMLTDYIYYKNIFKSICQVFFILLGYSRKSWPLRAEGIRPNDKCFYFIYYKTNLIG
mgnify:CR=1 FL=1